MFKKDDNRRKNVRNKSTGGTTLIETLVTLAIFSAIIGLVAAFQSDVFSLNRIIQTGLQNQSEVKKLIRPFANEVRSSAISNLGAYPIAETAPTSFSFYSDINGDGLREKVRYFLDDGAFKKGYIEPTGEPLEYDLENEKIINIVYGVLETEIFTYFDSSYDGTASSTALVQPVAPIDIRLVKVKLVIDTNPQKPPPAIEITTQVSIRNLKDNI